MVVRETMVGRSRAVIEDWVRNVDKETDNLHQVICRDFHNNAREYE